jgi:hypothetical protein
MALAVALDVNSVRRTVGAHRILTWLLVVALDVNAGRRTVGARAANLHVLIVALDVNAARRTVGARAAYLHGFGRGTGYECRPPYSWQSMLAVWCSPTTAARHQTPYC